MQKIFILVLFLVATSLCLAGHPEDMSQTDGYDSAYEDGYAMGLEEDRPEIVDYPFRHQGTPLDFISEAVRTYEPMVEEISIVFSLNPKIHASKIIQYIERLRQEFTNPSVVSWRFYKVSYVIPNGPAQRCLAGIGYRKGYRSYERIVDISQCNESIFSDDVFGSRSKFSGHVVLEDIRNFCKYYPSQSSESASVADVYEELLNNASYQKLCKK